MTIEERQEKMAKKLVTSLDELIAVFTEWDRRYREDPEAFVSEAVHLLKETAETYGDSAGPYFIKVMAELRDEAGPWIETRA